MATKSAGKIPDAREEAERIVDAGKLTDPGGRVIAVAAFEDLIADIQTDREAGMSPQSELPGLHGSLILAIRALREVRSVRRCHAARVLERYLSQRRSAAANQSRKYRLNRKIRVFAENAHAVIEEARSKMSAPQRRRADRAAAKILAGRQG